MFGSSVLEVAMGVMFVYLLLSLICTAINEAIASLLNKRGKNLFDGIKNLLNDPAFTGLAQQVYHHGLVDGISQDAANPGKPNRLPSYMPAANFSLALLDILGARGTIATRHGDLLAQAEHADDAYVQATAAAASAPGNPDRAEAVQQAHAAQQRAQAALEAVVTHAQAAYEAAVHAAQTDAGNPALATAVAQAKETAAAASAAVAMLAARRAAVAAAHNLKNPALLNTAAATLEQALAAGRAFFATHPDPLSSIHEAVTRLPSGHTKESLLVLIAKTTHEVTSVEQQVQALRDNIEGWFNNAMERVGGWYKRWTQKVLWGLACVIVVVSNADTVMLVQRLMQDGALRASLVAAAQDAAKVAPSAPPVAGPAQPAGAGALPPAGIAREDPRIQLVLDKAARLTLPLGWTFDPKDPGHVPWDRTGWGLVGWLLAKVFGLLVSVFAVSLGAPFWFDTLSKVTNLRGAGTPPGEAKKSAR